MSVVSLKVNILAFRLKYEKIGSITSSQLKVANSTLKFGIVE